MEIELQHWMALPASPMLSVSNSTDCLRFPDEEPGRGKKRWLYLAQNCSDYTGIRINGFRITDGLMCFSCITANNCNNEDDFFVATSITIFIVL